MCEARPGTRCATDTRDHAVRSLAEYRHAHPDGPSVHPLNHAPSRVCDTGTELRLVSAPDGRVGIEQVEFVGDEECWVPGATLSAEASSDLAAWLADPAAHTSPRTGRTRRWEQTWTDDEITFTHFHGTFSASCRVGVDDTLFVADFRQPHADRMSLWLMRAPVPITPSAC